MEMFFNVNKKIPTRSFADTLIKTQRDNGIYLKVGNDQRLMEEYIFNDRDKYRELNMMYSLEPYYKLVMKNYYNKIFVETDVFRNSEVVIEMNSLASVLHYIPLLFIPTDLDKYTFLNSEGRYGEISLYNTIKQELKNLGIPYILNDIYTIPKQFTTLKRRINTSQKDIFITASDMAQLAGVSEYQVYNGYIDYDITIDVAFNLVKGLYAN